MESVTDGRIKLTACLKQDLFTKTSKEREREIKVEREEEREIERVCVCAVCVCKEKRERERETEQNCPTKLVRPDKNALKMDRLFGE